MIRVIDYEPRHQPYFEKFNRNWIEKYFEMEPTDEEVLTNPNRAILQSGGAILIAECDGVIAGTVALRKVNDKVFEFTKMAVDENFRRRGIAEMLSHASFEKARQMNINTIILYSNSQLKGAILLYEKLGFRHIPIGNTEYKRSDVKMILELAPADLSTEKIKASITN